MSLHLALLVFPGVSDAGLVCADVRGRVGDQAWTRAAAVIERHRDSRVLVRGTWGRDGLSDDASEVAHGVGSRDSLVGAILGAALGPSGRMAGLLTGAPAAPAPETDAVPRELCGAYIEELRAAVAPESSALVLLAGPQAVDEMVGAFAGTGARLLRRHLSVAASRVLQPDAPLSP